MNLQDKCQLWIKCGYNVMFEGSHGIGKSAIVLDAFNKAGLKWKYFSSATLDPWVDLIGVPKETKDEHGDVYLDLIRPKELAKDQIEAIFFDEYNRAPSKVRNAVMELLQFHSINGHKFNNLKVIWAAINPADEDGTYDVDRVDPAQLDRFQVFYRLPNIPNESFFADKYGSIGTSAVSWWSCLPEQHQKLVSPRRLEYAIDAYNKGVDLRDVLSPVVRPKTLKTAIESVGLELTHEERWRNDPESYINMLASRTSNVDVVEAFNVLHNMSLDMAVSYVSKLPPAKLKLIAQDHRTRSILFVADSTKMITTALKGVTASTAAHESTLRSCMLHVLNVHPALYDLATLAAKDNLKIEPWEAMLRNVQQGVDQPTAYLFMSALCTCLDSVPESRWAGNKLISLIIKNIKYLFDFYRHDIDECDILSINPTLIHRAVWYSLARAQ